MDQSPKSWYIGCSGFYYREWKAAFYPEKLPVSSWFRYYTLHFNALEVNMSFYRFPQVSTLRRWHQESPEHFLFSLKAPRLITHYKRFQDCRELLQDFYHSIQEGLAEKLGPVLFQLPPQQAYDPVLLEKMISLLSRDFENVVEFRNAGWWREDVYEKLAAHRIIFCGANHPSLPAQPVHNGPVIYYRFHGNPVLFHSEYSPEILEETFLSMQSFPGVRKAFVFFNNTASLAALENAGQWQVLAASE